VRTGAVTIYRTNHFLSSKLHLSPLGEAVPLNELLFVCSTRAGAVLAQDHILKSDHFPSGRDATLTVQLPGAPNFRQVSPLSKK
jgi:hypothetical protein